MLSRREMIRNSVMLGGVAAAAHALPTWMPRLAFAQPYNNPRGDVMIVVFLRGGADSLNMIVPFGDDLYYEARPRLAIPRPDTSGSDPKALDLDGFFGLHPALAPLLPLFQGGQIRAIHATGSPHGNRSHFEAMDFMERGVTDHHGGMTTGWVARHLATLDTGNLSPVRGIGWGAAVQTALMGASSTIALQSIIDYHLAGDVGFATQMMQSLMSLYQIGDESLYQTAQNTQSAIDLIASVDYQRYVPQNGAEYPEDDFALALRQTAALIRADVGLEVACIDLGGWDTHTQQGGIEGNHARLMAQLANGLAAFHQDMGTDMSKVSLVVMSEFGRRLHENANNGTDHGQGGAMLVMSGSLVVPNPVIANWAGLTPDALIDGEDLAITIDYRDVLGELLRKRLHNPDVQQVFPDYDFTDIGIFG
ncbi:MAG: hypothetical protein CUN56_00755 [Phototrophicales bacterium]|nr:MAG: hypothetical protein CUN56_00755 [Phototrophicales bacterium]RMG73212.1 MAG: DUF1501 domain-containing protein [Chloroflexota bacterium]